MNHSYPNIGIGAVILNDRDEVLLLLRKKAPEANTWSIPGGKVELFEALEAATIREVAEEVGLEIAIDSLWCTSQTISPERGEHWISVIYTAIVLSGVPQNMEPEKIGDVRWFSLHALPKEIACFAIPAIEKLRNAKKRTLV